MTDDLPALLARDLDAGFTDLVRRHQQLLLAVALRTTGNRADAEDLAAEALLRAYRALRGWDADRVAALEVRAWLVTVLLNVRRNDARAASRRPRTTHRPEETPDPAAPGPGVEERALTDPTLGDPARTDAALAAALADLTPVQRAAVVLRHVVDLPAAEVARALDCAEGTARSHVSRGLARLRATLDERTSP